MAILRALHNIVKASRLMAISVRFCRSHCVIRNERMPKVMIESLRAARKLAPHNGKAGRYIQSGDGESDEVTTVSKRGGYRGPLRPSIPRSRR